MSDLRTSPPTPLHRPKIAAVIGFVRRWRGETDPSPRCWVLIFLLSGSLFGLLSLPVAAAEVDLPTYLQRLTSARDALMQAQSSSGTTRDAAIQRAQTALADIDRVRVESASYPAQHADILSALRRSPPDIDRAIAEITTLRGIVANEQTAMPDVDARQKLNTVLSDRAFREAEPNLAQKQVIRARDWIGEQLRRLFQPLRRIQQPNLPQGTPGSGPLSTFLSALGSPITLIVLAAALIAMIAIVVTRRINRRAKRPTAPDDAMQRTAAEWRQYADELAARGDYRAAVRALFLGTLTDLDERRLILFDPALTDREYLREAQRQQGWLVEPLRPFVRFVEAIVYADAPCAAADYARARAFTDDVRRTIGVPQVVAA